MRSSRPRCSAAVVAVPTLLFAVDGVARLVRGAATEFLLVPPLAVLIFLLFDDPERADARLRTVVLLPVLGAVAGELGGALLGMTPWGIALVVLAVLLAQAALGVREPPALAIAILAMLLRVRGPWYPLDVLLASSLAWLAFVGWRRWWLRRVRRA